MGLKSIADEYSEGAAFSRDILRVEICGPEEEHLTIIDVPGKLPTTQLLQTTSNIFVRHLRKRPRRYVHRHAIFREGLTTHRFLNFQRCLTCQVYGQGLYQGF